MKALVFDGKTLKIDDVGIPSRPDEALVSVSVSGICNTDIEIARGYAGFTGVIGHEFVGVVEDCASQPDLVGQRVVGEINAGCGKCPDCLSGDPRHCPQRTVLGIVGRDGAHAEYLSLPAVNLLPVPDSVSDASAVFVEPLAAAIGICERVSIEHGMKIAVIGDGKLGLLIAMGVHLRSPDVTLFGRHVNKLEIAEKRSVRVLYSADVSDNAAKFDIVVEASGSGSGFADALTLVKPRGSIVLKSTFQGEPSWNAAKVVVDEISVIGSRCGRFQPALDVLATGQLYLDDMISSEMPLTDGVRAMENAVSSGVLKVLLRP